MQAKVHGIEANDIPDWPHWSPAGPAEEFQWFTVAIGAESGSGADLFQAAVATRAGLQERRCKSKFVGLLVDRYEPATVERAIREFVAGCKAPSWEDVVDLLRARLFWEYESHRG